jgi:C4-dicarboxylate-specific signal transduction histidine kinase
MVLVRVRDSGPGIASVENLFQPFQKGAQSTGLGLYISRAFVRSFRGELRHEPTAGGCSFVIELAAAIPYAPGMGLKNSHGNHTALIA